MVDHDATIDTDGAVLLTAGADEPSDRRSEAAELCGPSLLLGSRIYPLRPGENVVGRGEDADVRLVSSSVSRRHARISIEQSEVVLEDLESRNGTIARDERLGAPTRLTDGDAVRFGVVWMVYRSPAGEDSSDEQ